MKFREAEHYHQECVDRAINEQKEFKKIYPYNHYHTEYFVIREIEIKHIQQPLVDVEVLQRATQILHHIYNRYYPWASFGTRDGNKLNPPDNHKFRIVLGQGLYVALVNTGIKKVEVIVPSTHFNLFKSIRKRKWYHFQ